MSAWKRTVAKALGNAFGVQIVKSGQVWHLFEGELLARFLSEFAIDCVFDVGANAGQYARRLREAGYRGAIVSFEPIPALAAQLRIAAKADSLWFVESVALDELASDVTLNVMANSQFSSLKKPNHADTDRFESMNVVVETIVVKAERLETVFDLYQEKLGFCRPFLKMDTQGNDLAVARGAGDRLLQFAGLQSELAIKRLYQGQTNYRESIDFYEASGFVLSSFVPNNAGHFPDLIEIDCIMYNQSILRHSKASAEATSKTASFIA